MQLEAGRRRQLAAIAALIWLFGYEVGPWLHLGMHAGLVPHAHTATGTFWADAHAAEHAGEHGARHGHGHGAHHEYGHGHGHGSHEHGHAHGLHAHGSHDHRHGHASHHDDDHAHAHATEPPVEEPLGSTEPALSEGVLAHGAHSLQHRGVAVLQPPPATPKVPAPSLCELDVPAPPPVAPRTRRRLTQRARGPPALGSVSARTSRAA